MPTSIQLRVSAIEDTMARWREKPFSMPKNDCGKLLLANCRQLKINIPNSSKLIGYKTPLAARSLLKKIYGVSNLVELCDRFWPRIAVAEALPSDPIAMPGFDDAHGIGSIGLYVGNDVIFGYIEDYDTPQAARFEYGDDLPPPITAWRLPV
jgi:hypothetical protein